MTDADAARIKFWADAYTVLRIVAVFSLVPVLIALYKLTFWALTW